MCSGRDVCVCLTRATVANGQLIVKWLPFVLSAAFSGLLIKTFMYEKTTKSFVLKNEDTYNLDQPNQVWNIVHAPRHRQSSGLFPNNNIFHDVDFMKKLEQEAWNVPRSLLNLTDFEWVMNNESICHFDSNASPNTRVLPVLIHTYRNHALERNVIRKSWGSIPIYKEWDVRLVFLLGSPRPLVDDDTYDPEQETLELENEQIRHGDLVMGNFPETWETKTYKHMMGYKWILNYCPAAEFAMKVDDDKFVDIVRWLDWRTEDLKIVENRRNANSMELGDQENDIPDLYCDVFSGGEPVRDETSNFYVSPEEWPGDQYPEYCSSWAYSITTDLMKMLYTVADEASYFWIDDVYFGELLNRVKAKTGRNPVVRDCFKTYMGEEKMYRGICDKDGTTRFDKEKEYGPVVDVKVNDLFEKDMMCLWNKTLHDSPYFTNNM